MLWGKEDINRTKAFFPDFIVWYKNFEEKYLICSKDFAPDCSYSLANVIIVDMYKLRFGLILPVTKSFKI